MNIKQVGILYMVFLFTMIPTGLVSAAQGDCLADMEKLCPDVDSAGQQATTCLKENFDALSAGCKENIQKLISAAQSFGQACGQDVKSLCAGVTPGGGRVLKCLKENQESLSSSCAGFLTKKSN